MPVFLFVLFVSVFGALTTNLTAAAGGDPLIPALATLLPLALTWVFRPQKAPEAAPEATFPEAWALSCALETLNADLWAAEALRLTAPEGVWVDSLPSESLFLDGVLPCVAMACETPNPWGQPCAPCKDDCLCPEHVTFFHTYPARPSA